MSYPLIMTEEFWANSQFSIARYYGCMILDGREYIIVDKLGRDVWECSEIAEREGRENAIEPGEPADLILQTIQPAYSTLGRERIIELIKEGKTEAEIIAAGKQYKREQRQRNRTNEQTALNLFAGND